MRFLWANPVVRSRYFGAAAAGLLLTAAFEKINIAGLAWVAPGLIVAAALGKPGPERWRIGYVAGLAHYSSMLYWLLLIPYRWHGLPLGPALGWVALSAFLALFTAVWTWMVTAPAKNFRIWGLNDFLAGAARETIKRSPHVEAELVPGYASGFARGWPGRTLWALLGAATWVALEMVLARIFGGFPWNLLGVSQYRMTPLIQMASITGVYGISFVVVWVSLALVSAGVMILRRPTARSVWVVELFLPLLVVAILFNQGLQAVKARPEAQETVAVTLIQPSIPQNLIWDPGLDTNRFNELVQYTDQVLTNKSDLVIWPESAVPKLLLYDRATFGAVTGLAKKHGVWMIIGSDDAEPRRGDPNGEAADYFNSSFLISPAGEVVGNYRKRGLVIFGEYVPLRQWLPFLKWFTPVQGGFTAGTGPVPFHLRNPDVTGSVLICFEDIFPHLGRTGVDKQTDFLVNITNDGWFGHSAAQWQQAMTGLFRAVENRVPLIRCCNNGLTCWIDRNGVIQQILHDSSGTVYGTGFLTAEIPVTASGADRSLTYYTRHGDVFGWICVGFAGFVLAQRLARALIGRRKHPIPEKVR